MSTLIVTTRGSRYWIDQDKFTLTRWPIEAEASDLRQDGDEIPVLDILRLEVGKNACFLLKIRDDGVPTVRTTTEVLDIKEVSNAGLEPSRL